MEKKLIINKRFKNILRKGIFVITVIIIVSLMPLCVIADSTANQPEVDNIASSLSVNKNEIIEEQIKKSEVEKIQEQLEKANASNLDEQIEIYNPQNLIGNMAKGKFEFSFKGLINTGLRYLFKELYLNLDIMVKLMVLVIICAVLKNLQSSFLSESVGELAFYSCYIVIVSIMLISFNSALKLGVGAIDKMVDFMYATVPVLITLLISGGNITSGGIFQPVLLMIVEVTATIMKNFFVPLIFLSTILSIVNNISDRIQISRLAGFLKQISNWSLGIIMTVFVAILALQGSLGAVIDGVTSKTAKMAVGMFIPVAGKYLADAADTVIGCTLLIKNAAGVAAILGIVSICLAPLIKLMAIVGIYKITCILVEPIADKKITDCINDMANSVTFTFAIVAGVSLMFFISITALIGASNISAMMR